MQCDTLFYQAAQLHARLQNCLQLGGVKLKGLPFNPAGFGVCALHLAADWRPAGLRALIYSGDHDLCVPHTGSEAWTSAMHRSSSAECRTADEDSDDNTLDKCGGVVSHWQPWYNSESPKQVGGVLCHADAHS